MDGRSPDRTQAWFVNLLGWLSFLGLFAVGVVGLVGGVRGMDHVRGVDQLHPAGVAYLAVGGLAFGLVLWLVLRRA